MEKSKSTNSKIADALVIVIFLLLSYGLYSFYSDNENLEVQIEKRDTLIRQMQLKDSLFTAQSQKNQSVVEKYISDCNIIINGKKVSSDELVQFLNKQIREIDQLNFTIPG